MADRPFKYIGKDLVYLHKRLVVMTVDKTKQAAIAVGSAVIVATPINLGRAKGNWQPSLLTPIEGWHDNPSMFGSAAAIKRLKTTVQPYTGRGSIFITNSLPYIHRLNNGWSAQQPSAGWIESISDGAFQAVSKKWSLKK